MKISIYELLGMVKDGKAPSKIKYDDMIWEYDGDYYCNKNNLILEEYYDLFTSLNDEAEILGEEKKIPEKLVEHLIYTREPNGFEHPDTELPNREEMFNKINEIIDYLDYLKSKGE